MKKINIVLISLFITIFLTSCINDIEIDTQEGPQLVGINGYISNEYKKHQIVISRTLDFYSMDEIEMISGAEVFVSDGYDTIYFEETDMKGYYETSDSVAGVIGRTYYLNVNYIDDDGEHNYYAQSTMSDDVPQIDSLVIKELTLGGISMEGAYGLYPYFQSSSNPNTYYLANVAINDSLTTESMIQCMSYSLAGLSGLYVNGPEFVSLIGYLPAYIFPTYITLNEDGSYEYEIDLEEGDEISMYLYCITPEFSKYISDINSNFGSNPMMGMPYNVSTNIYPEGKAVGFFEAYSSTKSTIIY